MRIMIQWTLVGVLALLGGVAQADTDNCTSLAGSWTGGGKFESGALACEYTGTAAISGSETFTANLHLQKSVGGRFCVASYDMSLSGSCSNGVLIINTSEYRLNGAVSANTVTLEGQLISPIEGDLSITINKS